MAMVNARVLSGGDNQHNLQREARLRASADMMRFRRREALLVREHLRHTAAKLLLVQGADPRTIMKTLGHSQISLTLNTYSHVLPALQADAAAKLDAILGQR
jgi:site-specific recombinase XerD